MALSVQNKNFLAVLSKLDIDIKQFPDKTFDGLFENVPEAVSYFFNWFIENITPDNALTQSEQATYFQLENSQFLPDEEKINYVLSSSNPGYEELKLLDINYINNSLSQDLEDLKKTHEELSGICKDIELSYNDIKNKQNNLKEDINFKKKQLITVKHECHKMSSLFGSKIDEVKTCLLKEPFSILNIDLFNELLTEEENIYKEFNSDKLLDYVMENNFSNVDLLTKLKEDLACVEISLVLSEGFLKEKKEKIEFLTELLQKEELQKTFTDYCLANSEGGMEIKISEEIKVLESEFFEKKKKASSFEVQNIYDQYMLSKIDLNNTYLSKLSNYKDYVETNWKINSCLCHILLRSITHMENNLNLRKQIFLKLNDYETNFTNDITNLELRKQRFKEVSLQEKHPLLSALKTTTNINENLENNEETLKNVIDLIIHVNDDSNLITHKFRSDLHSAIRGVFDNMLCGPTSQLLFVPIELLIKFQECKEREANLSQVVKRLANKYVDAKESISQSDRKRLLLWINFLMNSQDFQTKNNSSEYL